MILDLLRELNELDEHPSLEAKTCGGDDLGESFFETVCAFANEPDLGGGRLVLGVAKSSEDFFGGYEVVELSPAQKPLYFAKYHLPRGAWRRIGSTDQRCTDDDLVLFFGKLLTYTPDHTTLEAEHATLGTGHTTLRDSLPQELRDQVYRLGKRPGERIRSVILGLCAWKPLSSSQLAEILGRKDNEAIRRDHLKPMIEAGQLAYSYPDMERHPQQAYRTTGTLPSENPTAP